MDTILSVALGLGLAAACGFRVFVPLLVLSLASRADYVSLSEGFGWIASDPAVAAFAVATILEVVAYYVPLLDHALDVAATPAAIVAGMVTSASIVADLPPVIKWTAIIVGGGGAAALVQGSSVALRAASTAVTGGVGGPIVATTELVGSVLLSLVAVVLPLAAIAAVVVLVWMAWRMARRTFRRPVREHPYSVV
jgi:hypothetical protein